MLSFLCKPAQIICKNERKHFLRRRVIAAAAGLLIPNAAPACDLALALAVDVSGSVDSREFEIQMTGLANALRDYTIGEALVRAGATITVIQWTGKTRQHVAIDWTPVRTFEELELLAQQVAETERRWRNFATAIGSALEVAIGAFTHAPECRRRVIDVSGDGVSNEGPEPKAFKPSLSAADITVNALAIEGADDDVSGYYWENVIHGEGAFVITADGYNAYPEQIRQKLLKEVVEQVSALDDG